MEADDDHTVYLGDNTPIVVGAAAEKPGPTASRMSTKQRRSKDDVVILSNFIVEHKYQNN